MFLSRKKRHLRTIENFTDSLVAETIKITIESSKTGLDEKMAKTIENNGALLRKYERRRRLIEL